MARVTVSASNEVTLLEQIAYLSQAGSAVLQVIIIAVAVWAGWAAYRQASSFAVFELLKYAQGETFRLARREVIRKVDELKVDGWWDKSLELEASASDCCAHYDVLGRVLMFRPDSRLARFLEPWGPSIIRTFEALRPFVMHRRASGGPDFRGYEWLYAQAMLRRDRGASTSKAPLQEHGETPAAPSPEGSQQPAPP
jgi:hypothetical protein